MPDAAGRRLMQQQGAGSFFLTKYMADNRIKRVIPEVKMMKIFNTQTRKKEEFVPIEEGKVRMYVCGPTVYNFIHIGNARPMIVFDTVRRYFEYKGYEVNYVSNFTDVDDKIIKKANEEGVTAAEIAARYTNACVEDMKGMNVMPATKHPKSTEEID